MFLSSHIFGPILATPAVLAIFFFDPTPGYDIIVLTLGLYGFWIFPFLLKLGIQYSLLVVLSLLNLHFIILWNCFHYGGVASPTIIWVLVIPILSVFYIGGDRPMRVVLLLASASSFAIFIIAYELIEPGPNDLPAWATVGLGVVSTVGTVSYVASMSIYYARIFDAGVHLENEVQRRRRLAVELRKAVVAANQASASKSEFLAKMSHELRTPLNAIMGYAQLLREDAEDTDDDALAADVDRILDAGEYLVRLINLILDLSKIEAGRMELHLSEGDVAEVLGDVAERRREMIEAGGNILHVELDAAPKQVCADLNQFRKIVDSILENAAEHTRNGRITLSCKPMRGERREYFAVSVEDNGVGIHPDVLPTVMETIGATSSNASGGRYGGTGLSLTVANKLCNVMGGYISVESTLDHGSLFTVVLPVEGLPRTRERREKRLASTAAA